MSLAAASAPGKVVLTGEYAVLDGAPAIAMAINRRARVRFASGVNAVICVGAVKPGDTRLFDSVTAAAAAVDLLDGEFTLDTLAFVADGAGQKLGIGSSAALTVALAGVIHFLNGDPGEESRSHVDELAYAAHERFQGGSGSGVDIATSCAGGLIEYRRAGRRVQKLDWPEGLHMALISTGVAASTGSMIAKLDLDTVDFAWLTAAAVEAARSWSSADASGVVAATRNYLAALTEFDQGHQLGILGGGHDRLVASAAPTNVVYKPCGAGGGDIGVVLGTDAAEVDAFAARAVEQGFERLDARLDPNGLAVSGARS